MVDLSERACRGSDPATFFPDTHDTRAVLAALRTCAECPAVKPCLELAMRLEAGLPAHMRHGIWGARLPQERADLERLDGYARRARERRIPVGARA